MPMMIDCALLIEEIAAVREAEKAWHGLGERYNVAQGEEKHAMTDDMRTLRLAYENACQWLALRVVSMVKEAEADIVRASPATIAPKE